VTPGQWLDDLLAMPGRIRRILMVGEQTQAQLTALTAAIDEVAGELDALDAKLQEGSTVDADTARALSPLVARLRGLRPDEPTG
jgi:hypothetical protein